MSGGGKGVSSALALSNAITNLAGEHIHRKVIKTHPFFCSLCEMLRYMKKMILTFYVCKTYIASVFGEQRKLEPMSEERKSRWKKEINWLLSVSDYIVEFVPSQQKSKEGTNIEVLCYISLYFPIQDLACVRYEGKCVFWGND